VLPVTYRDAAGQVVGHGTVVHVSALLYDGAPNDLIAYGMEDSRFPHYSTGDQFLTEEQYRRLVLFGRAATETALADGDVRRAVGAALA
jgi:hypothetical protein